MWIIKNRVTGEYDRKGLGYGFSKITRTGWTKIAYAKSHIVHKTILYLFNLDHFNWYLDADFIKLDESGTQEVIPVGKYLIQMLEGRNIKLPEETMKRLEEYRDACN